MGTRALGGGGTRRAARAGLVVLALGGAAHAEIFRYVRVGDADGLGFGDGAGLLAANGLTANVDGAGLLGPGDYMPDLNGNRKTAWGAGDDWDNRTSDELANAVVSGQGVRDFSGTSGSKFTDVTISKGLNGFPKTIDRLPGFVFDFAVDRFSVLRDEPVFINVVFGDYDIIPASVRYTRADGSAFEVPLTIQGLTDDGLIQSAFAELPFQDVFMPEEDGYRGRVRIDFIAPREPYLAFDYAEISMRPIPTPGAGALLALGGLAGLRRRR